MVIHLQYTGMLCLHCGLVGVHFKFQMRHISMPSFSLCRDYVQMSCLKNRFFLIKYYIYIVLVTSVLSEPHTDLGLA